MQASGAEASESLAEVTELASLFGSKRAGRTVLFGGFEEAQARGWGLDIFSDSEKTLIVKGIRQPPCQLVWQELKVGG